MPDHQLLNADRAGPRKAHCSCGSWSDSPLQTASVRRAWHRSHVADLLGAGGKGPTS